MSNIAKVRRPKIMVELETSLDVYEEIPLVFTLNSYALMEETYGSVDLALEAIKSKSMKAVRFMLWTGMLVAKPEMTEEQLGTMLDMRDMGYYMDRVSEAMDADNPENAGKNVPNS